MRVFFFANRRTAFTLTELLVVISIIGLLAALVVGGVQSAMRSGKGAKSLSNMKQLTSAYLLCAADNNGQFPSVQIPGKGLQPTWDLQSLPYLGIDNAVETTNPTSPKLKPGLNLDILFCPLDKRKSDRANGFYPRSYGLTYCTLNHAGYDGGITRYAGEGIRLNQIPKPGKYVLLVRFHRSFENSNNVVGSYGGYPSPGPNPTKSSDPVEAESWAIYGGKTPYAFADGHVQMLTPAEALPLWPLTWNVTNN
jgi:prepilin-type N-terminal cleavage/methylation domain-containing protein/prepilin-type processing-associated H-X9-DG protein